MNYGCEKCDIELGETGERWGEVAEVSESGAEGERLGELTAGGRGSFFSLQ